MGRGKHCSEEERRLILQLRDQGNTYKFIADALHRSPCVIARILKERNLPPKQVETRGRPKKIIVLLDKRIVREALKDPFTTSTWIKMNLSLDISSRTIRRRLQERNLHGRIARKVPLLSAKNIKQRIEFAASNQASTNTRNWRNVLYSDETKINLFGSDGRMYVRRSKNEELNPRNTTKTVKHGGGNIKIWGCFSYAGVGPIFWIKPNMNKELYLEILESVMLPYAEDNMPLIWTFQQDNDPKHTAKVVTRWFEQRNVSVLPWPSQSPDLNPIENLWKDLKNRVSGKKTTNKQALWKEIQEAWYATPVETCRKLIDSMPRRCEAVLKNKGHATKY